MAPENTQPETTVLLTTLAGLASSTRSIDESVRRIASALESQSSPSTSQLVVLTYDEKNQIKKKDEEIVFLKEYIRMKRTYDKSVEVCTTRMFLQMLPYHFD
jgi:predicted Holliday junction resolvase-like endonuclease